MIEHQGEIDKSTIISRNLNTPFSITNRTNLHLEVQNAHKWGRWWRKLCAPHGDLTSPLLLNIPSCTGPRCKWKVPIKTSPLILLPGPASRTEIKWRPPSPHWVKRSTGKIQSEKQWWPYSHTQMSMTVKEKRKCLQGHIKFLTLALTENGVGICCNKPVLPPQ